MSDHTIHNVFLCVYCEANKRQGEKIDYCKEHLVCRHTRCPCVKGGVESYLNEKK